MQCNIPQYAHLCKYSNLFNVTMWIWCIMTLLIVFHVVGFGFGEEGEEAVLVGGCWEVERVFGVAVALKKSWVCGLAFGGDNKAIFIIISI